MNTAEVVIRKIQGDSDFQVLQHARESVGEPGQTPKLHSHGQVLPFNEAGRDMLRAGVSATILDITSVILGGEYRSFPCCP